MMNYQTFLIDTPMLKAPSTAIATTIDDLRKLLGDEFVVTLSSFKEPEPYSGEITLRGVNKATGIRDVVEFLHMSQADTIGFGDGQNDFDMLRYCGCRCCHGQFKR